MIVARKMSSLTPVVPIVAGLLLILLSAMFGVEYPIIPLVYSVLLLPFIIIGINYPFYGFNFPLALTYNYGLLIVNDLLLRYFSDSVNDINEKWISLSFYTAFLISTLLMIYMGIITGNAARRKNAKAFCAMGRCCLLVMIATATLICYALLIQGRISHSYEF